MKQSEAPGRSSVETSSTPTSLILSSTIETTLIDTSTSLPTFTSPIASSLSASTISPNFSNIMHQPITSLFSSQSTEGKKLVHEEDQDDDDVMVSFAEIQFDPEEDNIPDHMLMSGKHYKILNHKFNLLLQIQEDTGGRSS
ncbi:unnamed protein product [Lactuca virosa]|uniref:Uncharacterized protein n=1 Tax=Lactuca virosa TaxID=75947 RepID=A0AAU9LI87_9ASTR|nr:unnamed protein product [Lactuca virosa]